MGRLATIDGETVPLERATVGVLDRGFLYGDSVFETLRTYANVPFLLDRHLERLEHGARLLGIDVGVTRQVIEDEVLRTIDSAENDDSYVRITVTRGSGEPGLDPALATGARRVVVVMPLKLPPRDVYENGLRAAIVPIFRAAAKSPARGAKTGNYLENILALRAARERGASDALLVDADGRVIQGSASNVFFVEGGALVTPPEDDGILPGVTRSVLLEIAANLGIEVRFRSPPVNEIGAFDEAFLSSSVREIAPVVAVDGVALGRGRPGELTLRLLSAYREATLAGAARGSSG